MIRSMPENEKSRVLTDQEIRAVIEDMSTESARILNLMLRTGARPGECQKLRYEDIENQWWTCKQIKGQKKNNEENVSNRFSNRDNRQR